ncbi:phosphoserine phosphatase SerB [Rhodobacteraceae bacterium W635]|uniref:phosphoserine phosphatase SerB n=1 Tax=Nioella halotolerans TaxID=2303578 RepID=UPI000E3DA9B4|nr:phosphoserine phosphatase SerB [Rhodobacteraceae bacterium W635]
MYIATLLTNPATPRLDRALVDSLRNAWGGGDVLWLSHDVAAELPLAEIPSNRWEVWESLQGDGIDLVVQPADRRRKRMLLADMDSTMIAQECIDELADAAGIGDRVKEITARAMNGELGFEGALIERVRLLEDLPEGIIAEVLTTRITPTPGGKVLLATMRAQGGYAALVSGGFTAFTARIAADLGFDEHRANTLLSENGRLTGDVARPILGREAKVQALQEITARLGITPADVIAVGDGANDLGMLGLAGTGVALHAKPSVQAECDIRVNHGDLTALLYLQGYPDADFVKG